MSAYIVDRDHIHYLLYAAASRVITQGGGIFRWFHNGKWHELDPCNGHRVREVGQMLWDECIASVSHRYDNDPKEDLPGPIGEDYVYQPSNRVWNVAPIQVIKSCHCYAYQSCEHDGWETSEAKAFVDRLEAAAVVALPGYEAAKWGYPIVTRASAS